MTVTASGPCAGCGKTISDGQPYYEEAVGEYIKPDQPETHLGELPVLVGRNWYHQECSVEP